MLGPHTRSATQGGSMSNGQKNGAGGRVRSLKNEGGASERAPDGFPPDMGGKKNPHWGGA